MTMRSYVSITFAAILAVVNVTGLEAQELQKPLRIWAGLGFGGGTGGEVEDGGVSFLSQLVLQRAPHQAAIRSVILVDGGFPGGSLGVSEISLLYGRMRATGYGHMGMATGMAVGTFYNCPGSHERTCRFWGIPITAEAALTARFVGIGIQGFITLNTKAVFGGGVFVIPFGWMP